MTIQKRRNIEKLRSSAKELRSEKVDEALEELDEVSSFFALFIAAVLVLLITGSNRQRDTKPS